MSVEKIDDSIYDYDTKAYDQWKYHKLADIPVNHLSDKKVSGSLKSIDGNFEIELDHDDLSNSLYIGHFFLEGYDSLLLCDKLK